MIIKQCKKCFKTINYSCIADFNRRYKTGYCRNCYLKNFPKGKNAYNYKGGETFRSGYKFIHKPEHPNANKAGYVREHRVIMERHIGRFLKINEVIHHKDSNKLNNSIENLEIISQSEHARLHFTKGRLCNLCDKRHISLGYCRHHLYKILGK